ncbi:MAG: tetratricopeptide repeat protein [Candidatus Obscuribacterales bacterium]|nr:tetratricopeptide repeat protein [Candidatus Obscuribacterales bacterium]
MPAHYKECVSCGAALAHQVEGGKQEVSSNRDQVQDYRLLRGQPPAAQAEGEHIHENHDHARHHHQKRGSLKNKLHGSNIPVGLGVLLAVAIIVVFAGGTFFFLNRPTDADLMVSQGQKELANGQYAFAVKTFEKALAAHPNNPRVLLSLARAYVGCDQVDKAWQLITQAQQQGVSVIAEPQLASELANYYRQREQFEKAIELLRPLAQAGVPGKRGELADLDALWGDIALRDGDLEKALQCWEEVKQLAEGSRYAEADARLVTIDQKLADKYASSGDDAKALSYLTKLNTSVERPANLERTAAIYERKGDLDLAIDQYQKAMILYGQEPAADLIKQKLAILLERRGKELLDKGESDTGYGYLQQAKEMDTTMGGGKVALRGVNISFSGGVASIKGNVWNPGPDQISTLSLKADLYDPASGRVIWQQERRIIDEFEIPLSRDETRPFQFSAGGASSGYEFRVYLDGTLYKSYTLGVKMPKAAPAKAPSVIEPGVGPVSSPVSSPVPRRETPEDKTLKDLDL